MNINEILNSDKVKSLSAKRKLCCWLTIFYHNPAMSVNDLISIACKLHIDLKNFLQANDYLLFSLSAKITSSAGVLEKLLLLIKEINRSLFGPLLVSNNQITTTALQAALQNAILVENAAVVRMLLQEISPVQLKEILTTNHCQIFCNTVKKGRLEFLNLLINAADEEISLRMLMALNYDDWFHHAVATDDFNIVTRLIEIQPDILLPNPYDFFIKSCLNGDMNVLEKLIDLAPRKVQQMIAANDFYAFGEAASKGHLAILDRLVSLAPTKEQQMIAANDFYAFRVAASNGHLAVLDRLLSLAPTQEQQMIESDDFYAFRGAASQGHLAVLDRLVSLAPDKVQQMLEADYFYAFRVAASKGHLAVLNRLLSLIPTQVQQMITAHDFMAFREASSQGHLHVVNFLLQFPRVFAYAEMHEREYGSAIQPVIQSTLDDLRHEKAVFTANSPDGVFDLLDADKAELCFYMIRNIIRLNDATRLDDMLFLLEIPAVKNLVHTSVNGGQANELLRLALTTNNQMAAAILLNIPAVRALAEQNDYYRNEQRGGLDLRTLARDCESSMTALSAGEQQRLAAGINNYQPLIQAAGVDNVITDLRTQLEERYAQNPASITRDGQIIELPMSWKEFSEMALSRDERERALVAYYQNTDHTAWRYLSKPNYWMAGDAGYVNSNPHNPAERWSTFEEYLPVISMLYLAAIDSDMPAIDGHTLATRFHRFIDELALIGRAHNWDQTRVVVTLLGETTEEYDDLSGDKPSCYSGVKRRLFQSILGHPLFKILTFEDLKQELREFMREHFQHQITNENRDELAEVWNELVYEGASKKAHILLSLNVSLEQQEKFMQYLTAKYGAKFSEDMEFVSYIRGRFQTNKISPSHAEGFGGEVNLNDLLVLMEFGKTSI